MLVEYTAGEQLNINEGNAAYLFHIPGHCAGCKRAISILQGMNTDDWTIYLINAEDKSNAELIEKYHVTTAPTIIIFKDGEEVEKLIGLKAFLDNKEKF